MHRIPSLVLFRSKKRKRRTRDLISECDSIILTTILLYSFNQDDVHELFILFKSEQHKIRV